MEAAYNLGISVKRLDGWEPAEEHVHEYDGNDRLIRTVVRRESEWDDEQRGWMQAWLLYKANVHEPCGTYLPDATAPEAEEAWVAELPIRCHVCTRRSEAYKRADGQGLLHPEAVLWPVKRKG